MWVRGQNKQLLIDCNKFELSEDETDIIFGNVFDNYYILGTYATKERCLEVLDEIEQQIVKHNTKYYEYIHSESNKIEYTYNDIPVYQMPKE